MVKVSVIMPTYNRAYVINRAIASVIQQNYDNWELIIVDDGSSDNTEEIVEGVNERRIVYIKYDENKGANYARNIGISRAKGEYVCFLDSDNFWRENFLKNRIDELSGLDEEYGMVFGRTEFKCMEESNFLYPDGAADLYTEENIINIILKKGCIDLNTICIKRCCLEAIEGFDVELKRLQDWDLIIRYILVTGKKIKFIDNTLVCNCMQKDSISRKDELYWDSRNHILKNSIEMCRKKNQLRDVYFEIFGVESWIPMSKKQKADFLSIFTYEELFDINRKYIDEVNMRFEEAGKYATQLTDRKKWVFPNSLFFMGSRIIVYGYGEVGHDFCWQIMNSKHYELVGVIDKNYASIENEENVEFINIEDVKKVEYDYILIAIMKEDTAMSVKDMLVNKGCEPDKIVWVDLY